jgi:hypothetical protein
MDTVQPDPTAPPADTAGPAGTPIDSDPLDPGGPDVEFAFQAATLSAPTHQDTAEARAARDHFDTLMSGLCATKLRPDGPQPLLARFAAHRATLRTSRVIGDFQKLRFKLAAEDDLDSWKAGRDGLVAVRIGNIRLAREICGSLSLQLSQSMSLERVILGIFCALLMGLALVSAYLDVGPIEVLIRPREFFAAIRGILDKPTMLDATFGAAVFGGLGSVVSLLLRIGSFEGVRGRSALYLFLFGLFQPIIGLVIGGVVGAAFAAHLINARFQQPAADAPVNVYFVAVAGFLCGFSERVAKTALLTASQAAGLTGTQPAPPASPGVISGATARVKLPS